MGAERKSKLSEQQTNAIEALARAYVNHEVSEEDIEGTVAKFTEDEKDVFLEQLFKLGDGSAKKMRESMRPKKVHEETPETELDPETIRAQEFVQQIVEGDGFTYPLRKDQIH